MNKKKLYIDTNQFERKSCILAIELTNIERLQYEIIPAGKHISYMSVSEKKEKAYQILENEYDVHFIFEDNIPEFQFYPTPRLEIFAFDSLNGCFASKKDIMKDEDTSIYYIDNQLKIYYLASSLIDFLEMLIFYPLWKNTLNLHSRELFITEQNREYLCNVLELNDNNVTFNANDENKGDIIIFPTIDDAKKELDFYEIK